MMSGNTKEPVPAQHDDGPQRVYVVPGPDAACRPTGSTRLVGEFPATSHFN